MYHALRAARSSPAPTAAARIGRNAAFFWLFLLAALNSFSGHAVRAVHDQGWSAALINLLGISAVLWAALVAGLKILGEERGPELRAGDLWMGVVVAALALLPLATASMIALTLLSLHAIFTSEAGSPPRRAGIIFLAMAGALIWGRLFLATFSRPLLDLDAIFVAALLGAEQQGNMIWLASAPTRLVVAPGCSSMQGISLALLFWAMVDQLFKVRFGAAALLTCSAALAATVLINVLRIGAMLRFPEHLDEIHHGWGFHLSMWATLIAVAAICLLGARREIFARR